jgi:hypothetical protein
MFVSCADRPFSDIPVAMVAALDHTALVESRVAVPADLAAVPNG